MKSKRSCLCKTMTASSLSENMPVDITLPDKDVTALLKRIRIHPEAQRILGNSHVPIVCLERLSIRTAPNWPVLLQPVVPLIRLPCLTLSENQHVFNEDHAHQNVSYQHKEDITEITEMVSLTKPGSPSSPEQSEIIVYNYNECCTQPSSPGSSYSEAEQGFYCDTNYIQIATAGKHVNVDSEMEPFNLDLEENQEVVIIVDPEPDPSLPGLEQSSYANVDHECESNWEAELVCDSDASPTAHECCASVQQPVPEVAVMESDDFCAVCLIGGELLCCDLCPKVYHLACHIPSLISFPLGDWVCTLCRSDEDPAENYECETIHSCGVTSAPYSLSNQDQRRCEKLTLLLSCHELSAPFHEPVSPLARNYYQIIKRPIDLSVIRRKLDKCITLHYFNVEQFIDDVLLMFKNCATFNYPDSEVAQAGRKLELFFLCKLKEVFPDQTFPAANQDIMERARLQWLNGKKKESHKKKRHVFSAKQYCL